MVGSGGKALPNEKDGLTIARVVINELDTARFDPLLLKACARGVVKCFEVMGGKVDNLVRFYSSMAVFWMINLHCMIDLER